MKKINVSVLILCGMFFLISPVSADVSATGLSLDGAYQLALTRSEDIKIQEEDVVQAEERLSQAKGSLFPTISGVGTFLKQDASATTSTSPSSQNTEKLTADQPLFRGLREFAALRQTKHSLNSTEFLRDQARIQLYNDVSAAYYNLLTLFHDVAIYKHQIEVDQKRLVELKSFRKIGRSRDSDVLALEASIAALEASIEAARVQTENAWSVFSFLTGLETRPLLGDDEQIPTDIGEVGTYLGKLNDRPDLKSLAEAEMAADDGISIARGGHLPSLDLLGNYYFDRPGVLQPVKWDVQLALTIPIFEGGVIQSQVRQASSVHKQSELQYEKAKRQAEQQVQLYYEQLKIEYAQQDKQDKASDLAQKNYEAQLKDSRLGLVTNIDVLTALSSVQDSLRLSNHIHYQTRMDYLKLLTAVAERPKK